MMNEAQSARYGKIVEQAPRGARYRELVAKIQAKTITPAEWKELRENSREYKRRWLISSNRAGARCSTSTWSPAARTRFRTSRSELVLPIIFAPRHCSAVDV